MTSNWRDLTSSRRARWPAVRGAVTRPRLCEALAAARVLVVVAPAGYGKTTALAAGRPDRGQGQEREPLAWLTLDADDADPQVLAAGLALAAESLPGGAAVGALLDGGSPPRRVAARLADVLDACAGLLVLDEAQHLSGPLTGVMLRELLDCGAGRVALLSRTPLPLLELTPLEAAGEVVRLSAADLAFTVPEIGDLWRAHGLTPSGPEVQLAHAVTEGWPIAARFLAQAAAQGRVRLSDLADLDGGEAQLGTLFDYLAQEVLGPLEPAVRGLLTRSSVFEELTPELLEAVLEEPDAAALLETLADSGTFLIRSGEAGAQVYRAHPLLRAHLRRLLEPPTAQDLAARGAAYFEQTGRPRRALAAHLLSGDTSRAAALLSVHGSAWLALGRATLVERSLKRLPRTVWTPQLHALAGDALRLSSRYAEALTEYAQATPLARALGEVQVGLDTVQPTQTWAPLDAAEAWASGSDLYRVRRFRAENLLNAGQLAQAVALAPELASGARYALRTGDLNRALHLALGAAQGEAGGARAAQNHREGLLLASFIYAIQGDAPDAARCAEAGLAEGERLGSPFVRSLALARLGHAHLTAGDLMAARQVYGQALDLAQGVAGRLQAEPLMGLAYLAGQAGDDKLAGTLKAEALAQTQGDGYMLALLHLMTALGQWHAGHPDAAALDAAERAFRSCTDAFGLACVALARCAAGEGSAAQAAHGAAAYPFLLSGRSLFSPSPDRARRAALLARLVAASPGHRAELLPTAHALGYADMPAPNDTPGFEVQVRVLGRVAVMRERESRPRDWGRAKARDLLILLAVHSGGLSREAAQEALFPGADPGVGERNFRVTLHALGQVLEEGGPSGSLLERGEWIRLRHGPDLHLDLHAAQAVLEQSAATPGRLEALLALPPALAPTDLEAAEQVAARYAACLPDALTEEAVAALTAGQPDRAARAAERALTLDPAHEPAARSLMRAHQARANQSAVQRVYAGLCTALADLGLQALPETEGLYRTLTR
ncbi:AAA family ATPase [Deinococcus sp. QL22]|uniref:AAA family ATPase n=1 Tax=Deinococcus sp. QL22 TaxID=2939437 RepID=UPI0020173681|nr:AAA family ATPase [Deinococcus sp. QL22]UQN08335.1 transcriptional regulator [Deinococcus sp. QL22]